MRSDAGFDTLSEKVKDWSREMKLLKDEVDKKRTVIVHPESQFAKDPEKAKKLAKDWKAREQEQILIKLKKLTGVAK